MPTTTTFNQYQSEQLIGPVAEIAVSVGKLCVINGDEATIVEADGSYTPEQPVAGLVVFDIEGSRLTITYADEVPPAIAPAATQSTEGMGGGINIPSFTTAGNAETVEEPGISPGADPGLQVGAMTHQAPPEAEATGEVLPDPPTAESLYGEHFEE